MTTKQLAILEAQVVTVVRGVVNGLECLDANVVTWAPATSYPRQPQANPGMTYVMRGDHDGRALRAGRSVRLAGRPSRSSHAIIARPAILSGWSRQREKCLAPAGSFASCSRTPGFLRWHAAATRGI